MSASLIADLLLPPPSGATDPIDCPDLSQADQRAWWEWNSDCVARPSPGERESCFAGRGSGSVVAQVGGRVGRLVTGAESQNAERRRTAATAPPAGERAFASRS